MTKKLYIGLVVACILIVGVAILYLTDSKPVQVSTTIVNDTVIKDNDVEIPHYDYGYKMVLNTDGSYSYYDISPGIIDTPPIKHIQNTNSIPTNAYDNPMYNYYYNPAYYYMPMNMWGQAYGYNKLV